MIYLITGLPGSGKTLHMVSMLVNRADLKGRELYVDGIPELDPVAIPHNEMPEGCNGGNWQDWLPNGSILVIDEAQRYFRPRPNGSKVPDSVQAMETHRHKGVDIFILTQHPRLLDINVKSFVENHKHISKSQLGIRRIFEWQRAGNPDAKADVQAANIKTYTLDKSCYGYYKSAEIHTKIDTGKTWVNYFLPLIVVGGLAFIGYSLSIFLTDDNPFKEQPKKPKTESVSGSLKQKAEHTANTINNGMIAASSPAPKATTASTPTQAKNDVLTEQDFEPAIKGQPWTAPFYANLSSKNNVKSMPFPVACIKETRTKKKSCTCYTDQSTPIKGMDYNLCVDFADNGIYNPYKSADELNSSSSSMDNVQQVGESSYTDSPPIGGKK